MPDFYVKLDASYQDDERVVEIGAEAELVYVRSLAFAKRVNQDGRITRGQCRRLVDKLSDAKGAVVELVTVGLWTVNGDGWEIHNWCVHNPSREQLEEKKAVDRDRKRRSRSLSTNVTTDVRTDTPVGHNGHAHGIPAQKSREEQSRAEQELKPATVEIVEPVPVDGPPTAAVEKPFARDFAEFWALYPKKLDKAQAQKAYAARRRAGHTASVLLVALRNYLDAPIETQFRKNAGTFLGSDDGPWSEWVQGPPAGARRGPVMPRGDDFALELAQRMDMNAVDTRAL